MKKNGHPIEVASYSPLAELALGGVLRVVGECKTPKGPLAPQKKANLHSDSASKGQGNMGG